LRQTNISFIIYARLPAYTIFCPDRKCREKYSIFFNVDWSVRHRNDILVYKSQLDAKVTEFILSDNCSTYFGRHYHPSSGAQNNCNYSIW
jgi:hypothetical protein